MFCKSKPQYFCAKCGFKIKAKDCLSCSRRECQKKFHLICVDETDIRRESWLCDRCYYYANMRASPPSTSAANRGEVAATSHRLARQPAAQLPRSRSPPSQHLGQRQTNTHSKQVELYGVNKKDPETELELKAKVLKLGAIIKLNLQYEHVEAAYRVSTPYIEISPDHENVIIVRFITKTLRNLFLDKFNQVECISNGMIDKEDPLRHRIIRAHENLKYRDRMIFTTARSRALSMGYKYCWTMDGVTYVKKDDKSPFIKISSLQMLDKCLPPPQIRIVYYK